MKEANTIAEPLLVPFLSRLQVVVLLLLSLITFLFLSIKKKKIGGGRRQMINLPPGPPKLPIIGNLHQLGALIHRSFHQLSTKYGPVMLLQLGNVPTLVISSPDAARQILTTNDLHCSSRAPLAGTRRLSYGYLDVAFSPYGSNWKELRKVCILKLLSPQRVQSFRSIREEEIRRMIESINIKTSSCSSEATQPVNLSEEMTALSTNLMCSIAFGRRLREREDYEEVADKLHKLIREAFAVMGSIWASDLFPNYYYVGWMIDWSRGLHGRIESLFRSFDILYQQLIDDHLRRKKIDAAAAADDDDDDYEEDIIDALLKENQTRSSLPITHDHIKAVIMNILFGGIDTTAMAMVWTMAELARHPTMMKKAQDEIRECIGNKGSVSEGDIDQLHYLKMVVRESLRLHPPGALLITRESTSKFSINGYDVLPKTQIHVNVWAIGRDPESWENPDRFWPERFADRPMDFNGAQNFELIPFGWGRRGCPGRYMGITNVEVALANFLYHFDWKLPNGMKPQDIDMEDAAGLAQYKKQDLQLVPIKYKW